jgi:hypothetical protein
MAGDPSRPAKADPETGRSESTAPPGSNHSVVTVTVPTVETTLVAKLVQETNHSVVPTMDKTETDTDTKIAPAEADPVVVSTSDIAAPTIVETTMATTMETIVETETNTNIAPGETDPVTSVPDVSAPTIMETNKETITETDQVTSTSDIVAPTIMETNMETITVPVVMGTTPNIMKWNLLLIEANVSNFQEVYTAINTETTLLVTYTREDTYTTLLTKLQGHIFHNICLFTHASDTGLQFLHREDPVTFEQTDPKFSDFLLEIPTSTSTSSSSNTPRLDIMGCSIGLQTDFLTHLQEKLSRKFIVRASTDDTGNSHQGGDWHLEYGDGVRVDKLYFNASIAKWNGILATSAVAAGEAAAFLVENIAYKSYATRTAERVRNFGFTYEQAVDAGIAGATAVQFEMENSEFVDRRLTYQEGILEVAAYAAGFASAYGKSVDVVELAGRTAAASLSDSRIALIGQILVSKVYDHIHTLVVIAGTATGAAITSGYNEVTADNAGWKAVAVAVDLLLNKGYQNLWAVQYIGTAAGVAYAAGRYDTDDVTVGEKLIHRALIDARFVYDIVTNRLEDITVQTEQVYRQIVCDAMYYAGKWSGEDLAVEMGKAACLAATPIMEMEVRLAAGAIAGAATKVGAEFDDVLNPMLIAYAGTAAGLLTDKTIAYTFGMNMASSYYNELYMIPSYTFR